MSTRFNHLYYFICSLAALFASIPAELLDLLPPKAKPYIVGTSLGLMWLKSHWNLLADPPPSPDAQALKKAAGSQ